MSVASIELEPTVIVIDDDADVRECLDGLFRSVGLKVRLFTAIQEYLLDPRTDAPGCMVLDVRLPGKSGLEYFDEVAKLGNHRPVIFISGHADVRMSVRAMKAGAVEFLTKPVRDQELLDAVQIAIERDRAQREGARSLARARAAFAALTPRERDIFPLVARGFKNQQIATTLGLTAATVKLHRGHLMQKMEAKSLADIVRTADILDSARTS